MAVSYHDYLKQKLIRHVPTGVTPTALNENLFDWQKSVTEWALRQGKAAEFEECGLGKTLQQMSWASEISCQSNKPVLILAPLAVSKQTHREGKKFGININVCEMQADVKSGVNITNYEKLGSFDAKSFSGIVLDESSILKSYMGKTKRMICDKFKDTPYGLACTATPAPNDLMELLNHAEFLGIMKSSEALSVWFVADQSNSGAYKLKGHAENDFWQWVASWAVCIEKPSDIGYSDNGYILPKLLEMDEIVKVDESNEDLTQGFFRDIDMSAAGFFKEKHRTADLRAKKCAELATSSDEQYLVWCYTNEESDMLKKLIPAAVEVRGSDKVADKEKAAIGFTEGDIRVLISKPSIFGYGLNFQNCHNAIFCGLDYSYESYYQAIRRLHRFGQLKPVNAWRVLGSTEKNILDVINRKQDQKDTMTRSMSVFMKEFQTQNLSGHRLKLDLQKRVISVPAWIRSETA
ncbi:MAG: DEAD/DEAH box helicase [Oscillospiraceae bacterium]